MKTIEITDGTYAAQWYLTDFYKGSEARLRKALDSDDEFVITYGCKKEIRYCTIVRAKGVLHVEVRAEIDDLYDGDALIYDALYEACGVEDEIEDDDLIEEIRRIAAEDGLLDFSSVSCDLDSTSTFEQLCEAISKLEDEAETMNTDAYGTLCDIAKAVYEEKGVTE